MVAGARLRIQIHKDIKFTSTGFNWLTHFVDSFQTLFTPALQGETWVLRETGHYKCTTVCARLNKQGQMELCKLKIAESIKCESKTGTRVLSPFNFSLNRLLQIL
jgi:hypothetical protein